MWTGGHSVRQAGEQAGPGPADALTQVSGACVHELGQTDGWGGVGGGGMGERDTDVRGV